MKTTGGDIEDRRERRKKIHEKWLQRIESRLSRYYVADEIDIDLANAIHEDADEMIVKIRRLLRENESLNNALDKAIDEITRLEAENFK